MYTKITMILKSPSRTNWYNDRSWVNLPCWKGKLSPTPTWRQFVSIPFSGRRCLIVIVIIIIITRPVWFIFI